jgi:hypothetical protein
MADVGKPTDMPMTNTVINPEPTSMRPHRSFMDISRKRRAPQGIRAGAGMGFRQFLSPSAPP